MRALEVIGAGQVLLDGVQTSPGVYKHCHAGLEHFWEHLPELNGGWSEDSSSNTPAASGTPQNGKQDLAFAGLQTKKHHPIPAALKPRTELQGPYIWFRTDGSLEQTPPQ